MGKAQPRGTFGAHLEDGFIKYLLSQGCNTAFSHSRRFQLSLQRFLKIREISDALCGPHDANATIIYNTYLLFISMLLESNSTICCLIKLSELYWMLPYATKHLLWFWICSLFCSPTRSLTFKVLRRRQIALVWSRSGMHCQGRLTTFRQVNLSRRGRT